MKKIKIILALIILVVIATSSGANILNGILASVGGSTGSAPSAPTGGSATSGDTIVTLNPGTSTGSPISYNAYFTSDNSTPTTGSTKITGVTNGYSHTGRTNGTQYRYGFTGVNGYGESSLSSIVSATPLSSFSSGLVGQWKLANGTWTDISGNSLTLTATGSAPTQTAGHTGTANAAANFVRASTQYLYHASTSGLQITDNITMSAWVKLASENTEYVISKGDSSHYGYALIVDTTRIPRAWIATSNGTSIQDQSATTALTLGTWYHIAATYDGSNLRVYVNGVNEGTHAYSGSFYNASSANFVIGGKSAATEYPFDGGIDDVALWNRTLSGSEITALYNLGNDFQ